MKAKQRVPALRGGQPGGLAANGIGCDRISLRRTSGRRKIVLNSLGIRGMSGGSVRSKDARGFVVGDDAEYAFVCTMISLISLWEGARA
jgi:hypothetical protein